MHVATQTSDREPSDSPHVLIVEDDDSLRAAFKNILESEGYRVSEFRDGTSAREYFEACLLHDAPRPTVDCIVSDLRMPGCDGLEVIELIESLGRYFPAVLVTGYGDRATRRRAHGLGVAVLDKPVRRADLTDTVRRAIAMRED